MTSKKTHPPVIFTDDGWLLSSTPPVTAEDLRQKVVGSYAGTRGALWWSTGDHEVYHFETEVGERFGEDAERLDTSLYSFVHSADPGTYERIATNLKSLIEAGGPLKLTAQMCREARLQFFPRVRMNSHYVIEPEHPGYGRFRRQHPEWLIGKPGESLPENSIEWAIRTGLNYAFEPVRDQMRRIIFEVFESFDVDGVEMDFMRHPGYFRIEQAYANRYLMTDLVRSVKERMRQVGAERGRELSLAVRVPPTLADSLRVGLDVERWIGEGLVDIVVVGGGFISFETPVWEFVKAAQGTDCLVYGCIEATRYCDALNMRALASRWLRDGAAGIYLYNFFTMSPQWNQITYAEISDLEAMKCLDKRYETDQAGPISPTEGHSGGFRYASPETQMPVVLQPGYAGQGPVICLDVADEVEDAQAEGVLGACALTLRLQGLTAADELEVQFNGEAMLWSAARVSFEGWQRKQVESLWWVSYPVRLIDIDVEGVSVEFDIGCPPFRAGINEVEVHLMGGGARSEAVVLEKVEILVTYNQ